MQFASAQDSIGLKLSASTESRGQRTHSSRLNSGHRSWPQIWRALGESVKLGREPAEDWECPRDSPAVITIHGVENDLKSFVLAISYRSV